MSLHLFSANDMLDKYLSSEFDPCPIIGLHAEGSHNVSADLQKQNPIVALRRRLKVLLLGESLASIARR
jgi:hypothetical protein